MMDLDDLEELAREYLDACDGDMDKARAVLEHVAEEEE